MGMINMSKAFKEFVLYMNEIVYSPRKKDMDDEESPIDAEPPCEG